MQILNDKHAVRDCVRQWQQQGLRVGLVPTMGNLHAGHMALVQAAVQQCDKVVTSIFVNPTQFAPDEDLARYPRTPQADLALLEAHGCDAVFMPSVDTMYPLGLDAATQIHVPALSTVLEGAHRPSHFDGMCTVVARLFLMVPADHAFFGQKDYQQLKIVQRMVHDLALPMVIESVPTEREADGLALSSRNTYLSMEERQKAPLLHQVLADVGAEIRMGAVDYRVLEQRAQERLQRAGFVPDYVAIRRRDDLRQPDENDTQELIILVAARLGTTRLIDNLLL